MGPVVAIGLVVLFLLGGRDASGQESDDDLPPLPPEVPPPFPGTPAPPGTSLSPTKTPTLTPSASPTGPGQGFAPPAQPINPINPTAPSKGAGLMAPGSGGPKAIEVASDCSVALLNQDWRALISPTVDAALAAGAGLPIFSLDTADRSVDSVIRTIVTKNGGAACVDSAPWLDRHAKANNPPEPVEGETALAYFERLAAWDKQWDDKMRAWASSHPQAFNAFREIGHFIVGRWRQDKGIGTVGAAGNTGQANWVKSLPPAQRAADIAMLRRLGYSLDPIIVEVFQIDFNLVMNFRTNLGWTVFGLTLDDDNIVGPRTREALAEALSMAGGNADSWNLLVATAREG